MLSAVRLHLGNMSHSIMHSQDCMELDVLVSPQGHVKLFRSALQPASLRDHPWLHKWYLGQIPHKYLATRIQSNATLLRILDVPVGGLPKARVSVGG
jgi:hypothetical protein